MRTRSLLVAAVCMAGVPTALAGTTYYVNPGQSIQTALNSAFAGDTVILRDGTHNISDDLDTVRSGTAASRITLRAENSRGATVLGNGSTRLMEMRHAYITVQGLVFDGQWAGIDLINPRLGGDNLIIRDCEVRQGARDGIDILGSVDNVLIEDCLVHDTLWWRGEGGGPEGTGRDDAHGIVANGATNLTVRNTEVYHVSGDALQMIFGNWANVLVEGCHFWNEKLPTARGGFPAGKNPGENAIDSKKQTYEARQTITLRDCVFNGWAGDYIERASALRLKMHCDVVVESCTLYDNHIAMRIGKSYYAPADDVSVTARNNVIYRNDIAVDYLENPEEMIYHNNTFGDENARFFERGSVPVRDEDILNNLFLAEAKPAEASDESNLTADAGDFVDSDNHDYHLIWTSDAVDAGLDLLAQGVTRDRDGNARYFGAGFDVGAYETPEPATLGLLAIGGLALIRRKTQP